VALKILFFIQGFDTAASRYRVLQYIPLLEAEGVTCEVRTHPRGMRQSLAATRSFGLYDAVFIQRHRLRNLPRLLARSRARRLVFDFDDAIMFRNSLARSPHSWTRMRTFRRMVEICHSIIVGNSFLLEQTRPHTRSPIRVIPSPIDTGRYEAPGPDARTEETVTVGWIGAHGSIHYLRRLRPAFDRAFDRDPRLRLKIICDTFFSCDRMPVIEKTWSKEEEVTDLKSLDVGVMPLLDDPWSRGKCGLKILQYLAAGVPVICTPVGINRDIVTDGGEGLWARTEDEWVEKILTMAGDPALRARMGEAGRRKVAGEYSVAACFPAFREALLGDA
jgi:glycosyltransferase involved in cell wall biosynthesis